MAGRARASESVRGTALRLAVRNVHRPGALTPSVVLSLGLGLTLLVSLALIDTNLRGQLSGAITEKAPDFFFIDIQDSERDAFVRPDRTDRAGRHRRDGADAARPHRGGERHAGRRSSIGTKPASWALRGDRGLTYSDTLPPNSTLVAGAWWPKDYDGEPLVSLENEIADDLGLTVGDTITVNVLGRNVTARDRQSAQARMGIALHQFRDGVLAEHAARRAAHRISPRCGCRRAPDATRSARCCRPSPRPSPA